jgi:hypothetical protein
LAVLLALSINISYGIKTSKISSDKLSYCFPL